MRRMSAASGRITDCDQTRHSIGRFEDDISRQSLDSFKYPVFQTNRWLVVLVMANRVMT